MPTVFESVYHPGKSSWGLVYTRFLARPLGVCTVPLMIGATTSALLGEPIWGYLVWGLPSAVALATMWTHFTISRTIAEVALRPGQAAFRSIYEVLRDKSRSWNPVFSVRVTTWHIELSVGRTTHMLKPDDWPDYNRLKEVARKSFRSEAERDAS